MWTSVQWQWKSTLNSPKLHYNWSLTLRLVSVISGHSLGWEVLLLTQMQSVYYTVPADWTMLEIELFDHSTACKNEWCLIEVLVIHENTWNHLIVCKQIVMNWIIRIRYQYLKPFNCGQKISQSSFKNIINKMCLLITYISYISIKTIWYKITYNGWCCIVACTTWLPVSRKYKRRRVS